MVWIIILYLMFFFSPAKECKINNDSKIWGIDISHHQKIIDWDVLIDKNKPNFIYLKCTEGSTYSDHKYNEYLKKAKERGIIVGAYHYFSYTSSGKNQAKNYIKNSKIGSGYLYPVLDVEYCRKMESKKWIISEIKSYCNEIKKEYGVYPILYCTSGYYSEYLRKDFKDYNYWILSWNKRPDIDYVIWQYSENTHVHGIGKIDNDTLYGGIDNYILKSKK